ncbi:nuclear transport factor 2 family protein [Hamadaea tsunoensis]|uniref:hypothetical protein n=1 Tax=Hamadaea tsunoensis TaxID=53368 RepID=UPI00042924CC|nr:hypothetical protein [Hamadaea tsunoensis]
MTETPDAKAAIDHLMTAFLGAFANPGGGAPDVDVIYDLFLPDGMIISMVTGTPVVYDLRAFVEPRRAMLTDGTLTDFREWETGESTQIFQSVAHRFSTYSKCGYHHGTWFEGRGAKTTQFVRTPDGWKISSLAWDDV